MPIPDFLTIETRRKEAVEFFGWPLELIDVLFKHSKEVMDNPWFRYHPLAVDDFYKCPYYLIRQLSYQQSDESMLPGQQSRNECDIIIKNKPCSVLEIGAGNFDLSLYLASHGVEVYSTEHSGTPYQFGLWRSNKYGLPIKILCEKDPLPNKVDFIIANSVLDHLYNNLEFTRKLCTIAQKHIFARPEIDEHFAETRPETHDPVILKDVPECFRLIRERNKELESTFIK
jgi:hypothetical protein